MDTHTKSIGNAYEIRAASYLQSKGYFILEKNYRCRYGEIDLIVQSPDKTIVFVEVKSRRSYSYGCAAEAITSDKREKIRKTSLFYIHERKLDWDQMYRYDVITFQNDILNHIENAFF